MIFFFTWIILFGLLVFALSNPVFYWIVAILYLLSLFTRIVKSIQDHNDWKLINERDEKIELENKAQEMAERGMTFSSIRNEQENIIKQNFELERKKKKRELWIILTNSLFLK